MDPRVAPLAEMLRMNTHLYRNCLVDLADDKAKQRPAGSGETNCAAFIAAHLVDSRHYLLGTIGVKQPSPLKGAKGGFNSIENVTSYPPLSEVEKAWTAVGKSLDQQLGKLTTAELDAELDSGFPLVTKSMLGVLTFLVQHESYHLGQLGLLRKHAGLPAMAYS